MRRCTVERLMKVPACTVCAATVNHTAPRLRTRRHPADLVNGTSPPTDPTACGSPTSRTSAPAQAGYTPPRQDVCTRPHRRLAVADHLRTELALDALQMAFWVRRREAQNAGLRHHSDKAFNTCVALQRKSCRRGCRASVGSTGDSYDNAMAEHQFPVQGRVHSQPAPTGSSNAPGGTGRRRAAAPTTSTGTKHPRLHGELGMIPPSSSRPRSRSPPARRQPRPERYFTPSIKPGP